MITFLQGKVADKQPTRVVIDVNGVGYEVFIPLSSYDRLPAAGETCRILTYDHVREDAHQLFGFMTEDERGMFLLLLGITGIGPKLALSALSGLTVRELRLAVTQNDVKRLGTISGVGKKLAERMVIELRDKISDADALEAAAGPADGPAGDGRTRDAVLALIALGFKQNAAREMVASILKVKPDKNLSVEDIVRKALSSV